MNRYYGWYQDTGFPEVIKYAMSNMLDVAHEVTNGKPVIITEYGADTVAGLHTVRAAAIIIKASPASTKHSYNIYTMLDQRRRRLANVV